MIARLTGELAESSCTACVVDAGGVGYDVSIPLSTFDKLPHLGERVRLYIHTQVREDAITLFGFATQEERELFQLLIGVNGVGPKAAVSLLSSISLPKLILAITAGDAKALKAPNVGPKTAQRIVLELRDKLSGAAVQAGMDPAAAGGLLEEHSPVGEAVSALVALGYTQSEAASAISGLEEGLPVEELVKAGLKRLMRR